VNAPEYRAAILEALAKMGITDPEIIDPVKNETDIGKLALRYQVLREVVAKETTGEAAAPFTIKMPNGSSVTLNNLSDAEKFKSAPPPQRRRRRTQ